MFERCCEHVSSSANDISGSSLADMARQGPYYSVVSLAHPASYDYRTALNWGVKNATFAFDPPGVNLIKDCAVATGIRVLKGNDGYNGFPSGFT